MKAVRIILFACLLPQLSSALTFYRPMTDPNYIRQQANPYEAGNPYNVSNHNNPYSQFRNPYDPDSAVNDLRKYGGRSYDFYGVYQGSSGQYVNNPYSTQNPYEEYGNPYNPTNVRHPYNPENPHNPYSSFRSPYDPNSVFNLNRYKNFYENIYSTDY